MIPKVSRGSDPGGLVRYLLDVDPERTRNVHTSPHLIAGSPSIEAEWSGRELARDEGRGIGRELDGPRRAFRTNVPGGHVWHCSLSLRADEGQLPDEQWARIARAFVEGMGFDGPGVESPCRWLAVHHGLSAAGNPHIHLAVSLVRENGEPANVFRDYKRAQRLCRDLEREHGLHQVAGAGVSRRGLSRPDVERRARGDEPLRWRLERTVRAVAAQAGTESQFVRGLRSAGLLVRPHWAKGGESVNGYAVAVRVKRGERGAVYFGGGQLASDLSLPRLRMLHRDEWGQEAAAVGIRAWLGRRGQQPEQERQERRERPRVQVTGERVASYAEECRVLRERMQHVPAGDTATWAATAHQLAGVLSAWSLAAEGARPGPLAAAAREVARSAQVPAHVARHAGPVPSLRGASLIVASAAVGGRGPVGQAVLLRQIVASTRMVHDAHTAERHADEAARLAALAVGEFAQVRSMLPSPELSAKVARQSAEQARPATREQDEVAERQVAER